MGDKDADIQKIKELIAIMKENDLMKIDIQHGDDRIALERAAPHPPATALSPLIAPLPGGVPPLTAPHAAAKGEGWLEIKAPLVGTFYEAPSPDSGPYVELGSHVETQTIVCIIEAMKVMNEIRAELSGTIVEKVATNGQAVEYGQVLFRVKPD